MVLRLNKLKSFFSITFFILLISPVQAQTVNQVISEEQKRIKEGQASQKKVDKLAESTEALQAKSRAEEKIIEGLKIYNQQLIKQAANQEATVLELQESIANIAIIERQIVPLTLKMIDTLEDFVEADVPFLLEERRKRVENLHAYMSDASITVAERFRKVLEAYEIENEYGRTIESYNDLLALNGQSREVNILRVGRLNLYYQTKDGKESGVWDKTAKMWQPIDSSFNRGIRQAIRVANKQVAPELLTLPMASAEK